MTSKQTIATLIEESGKLEAQFNAEFVSAMHKHDISMASSIMLTSLSKTLGAVIAMNKNKDERKHMVNMVMHVIAKTAEEVSTELQDIDTQISTKLH
jgi:hypothetical protein